MFSVYSINDIQVSLIEELLAGAVYHSHDNVTSCLLFEEPSTRTKESFRIAFNNLGIQCIDILPDSSSISKGETLKQTLETVAHYKQRTICVWRSPVKMPQIQIPNVAIINAGDGINEHPTQALGDLLTIQKALNVKFSPNFLRGMNLSLIHI